MQPSRTIKKKNQKNPKKKPQFMLIKIWLNHTAWKLN